MASCALLLPHQLFSIIASRAPRRLARGRIGLPIPVKTILGLLPGRVHLAVGGFVLGYLGKKYINWLRLLIILQLLKYHGWMYGRNWKVKVGKV